MVRANKMVLFLLLSPYLTIKEIDSMRASYSSFMVGKSVCVDRLIKVKVLQRRGLKSNTGFCRR